MYSNQHIIDYITKNNLNIDQVSENVNLIISINIHFHLTLPIKSINEHNINYKYLHYLVKSKMENYELQLNEMALEKIYVKYTKDDHDDYDENGDEIYYIVPSIKFIPVFLY